LDSFNAQSRANAGRLTEGLKGIRSIVTPLILPGAVSTFYQYCIYSSDCAELSKQAIRRGIDVEIMHVDICSQLPIFADFGGSCPQAERTEETLQVPVYTSLQPEDLDRILAVIRKAGIQLPASAEEGWLGH